MKRLIPALICIAAAFFVSLGSYDYIKNEAEYLCSAADRVLTGNNAAEDAYDLCEEWERVKILFGALLKHSDYDRLEELLIKTEDFRKTGQTEELLSAVEECRTALRVILAGEKADAANIF